MNLTPSSLRSEELDSPRHITVTSLRGSSPVRRRCAYFATSRLYTCICYVHLLSARQVLPPGTVFARSPVGSQAPFYSFSIIWHLEVL